MLIDTLVESPWLVSLTWAVLSIFDFSATMLYSKAYRDFLSSTVQYERGVEMNPMFEKDVKQLRWFSPRYILLMLGVALLIGLAGMCFPAKTFEMLAGTAILLVLVIDLRHIENLSFVWFLNLIRKGSKARSNKAINCHSDVWQSMRSIRACCT